MLELRDGLDLLREPIGAERGGELGAQHLDGDLAVVLEVEGKIDGRHPAGAELTLDRVPARESRGETGGVGHL